MRKLLSLLIVLSILSTAFILPAFAEDVEVTLFSLKVEIDPALQKYAQKYMETHPGVKVKIESLGGGADYAGVLKSKKQAGQMPSIFQIEGQSGYDLWAEDIADISAAKFNEHTVHAFKNPDGVSVGFPVAIEGYGLGYNKDILDKAGVDPASLNTFAGIQAAFEKLDAMKADLGLDAVVASAASISGGMWWSMGQHVWNVYYTGGLEYTDRSLIDMAMKEGKVDKERLDQFAKYVKLLMDYSDQRVLTSGSYNDQISAFATEKTAFICQGNWTDPNMQQLDVKFNMGYAPHAFLETEDNGILISPPSWWVVNAKASDAEKQAAMDFLDSIALTEDGAEFMVKDAGMVPAFDNVTLEPSGQFSRELIRYNKQGGNHNWYFALQPGDFGMNSIGPVMDLFAQDHSDASVLSKLLEDAVAQMPSQFTK